MANNKKKKSGIYQIRYLKSGRCYIGQTQNFTSRWTTHRSDLRSGKHSCKALQEAWSNAGPDYFKFEILYYEADLAKRLAMEAEEIRERVHPFNTAHNRSK